MKCTVFLPDLITITIVFFSPGLHGDCDPSWYESGDHCYYVGMKTSIITWDISEKECLNMGGHLASIESTSEYYVISGYLMLYSFTTNDYAWIGLNDIVNETEWVWSDGTIYNSSVSRWKSGQPDNGGYCYPTPCSQDCVALVSDYCERIWWYDRDCSGSYYGGRYFFICKKEAVIILDETKTEKLDQMETGALTQACDSLWHESGDHCYYVGMRYSIMSWDDSEKECLKMSGNLASIESTSEYITIIGYLMLYSFTMNDYAWIGLNDIVNESKWVWSDGTIYNSSVSRWQWGEPNNGGYCYPTPCNQDCVALVSDYCERILWNDRDCSGSYYPGRRYFFICKKGSSPTTQSNESTEEITTLTVTTTGQAERTTQDSIGTTVTNGSSPTTQSNESTEEITTLTVTTTGQAERTTHDSMGTTATNGSSPTTQSNESTEEITTLTVTTTGQAERTTHDSMGTTATNGSSPTTQSNEFTEEITTLTVTTTGQAERTTYDSMGTTATNGSSPTTQYNASTEETTTLTVTTTGQAESTTQDSMGTGATNETTSGSSTTPVGRVTTSIQNGSAMAAISTSTPMTRTQATTTGAILSTTEATTLVESSTSTVLHLASFTEPQPTIDTKCSCRCSSLLRKGNMTSEELANFVRLLTEELTVNKSTLSSTRRKLTSAPDERPSSVAIGSTIAIVVMCCVFCPIIILDILRCIKYIWN